MRVVLTSAPVYSHLVPVIVPLAQIMQRGGVEVFVATGDLLADELDRRGIPRLRLPRVRGVEEIIRDPETVARLDFKVDPLRLDDPLRRDEQVMRDIFQKLFIGSLTLDFADDLMHAIQDCKPDLIVRESTEFAGYVVAEKLGIPHAVADITPLGPNLCDVFGDWINQFRTDFGLDSVSDPVTSAKGILHAGALPQAWYPTEAQHPVDRYYLAPVGIDRTPLDPEIANLPVKGPLVLASLGSKAPKRLPGRTGFFPTIIEALGQLPCTAIVSLDDAGVREWAGRHPKNVHVTSFMQQQKILQSCDMFLTHSGFNGMRESIIAGTPMMALPLFGHDQLNNAARLNQLGMGRALDVDELTVESLVDACHDVLTNPSYRWETQRMQRQYLGLPSFDQLTTDLEALVH